MPRHSGPTKRDMFPGHGAGKGDKERSSVWRKFYDEIDFHRDSTRLDGFKPIGLKRSRKTYSQFATATPKCKNCGHELIDPELCYCGELRDDHGSHSTHGFIPQGCLCHTLVAA